MVSWFVDFHQDLHLNDDSDIEMKSAVKQIQDIYATVRTGIRPSNQVGVPYFSIASILILLLQHRNTALFSAALDGSFNSSDNRADISAFFAERVQLVGSLSRGFAPRAMKLLVAMSALLQVEDYRRIGPLVWENYLDGVDSSLTASVSCV